MILRSVQIVAILDSIHKRAYVELVRAACGSQLTPIIWASNLLIQENIVNILDLKKCIVHFRNNGRNRSLATILDKGYRIVFSNRDAWQFDYGFGDCMGEGHGSCCGYKTWQQVYDNNTLRVIAQFNKTEELDLQSGQVIVGEAAVWSEHLSRKSWKFKFYIRQTIEIQELVDSQEFNRRSQKKFNLYFREPQKLLESRRNSNYALEIH